MLRVIWRPRRGDEAAAFLVAVALAVAFLLVMAILSG
jgi:hypothetical protein